ncbi:MAG: SMP-30/gluconolactonase/LRE family protein [Alphaproteobacteria bacterium]|nr:SMP-30/gluconolactonase/LRE family protein [Alphaproteobacteria bacterium]
MTLVVHATLPDRLRGGPGNDWAAVRRHGARGDCFLEGPCWSPQGDLWCVDIANGRLLTLRPGGGWTVRHEYDGWPTGLKLDAAGCPVIADNRLGLLRFDPAAGRLTVLADRFRGDPLIGPNDLAIAADGAVYFTDQGNSDLVRPEGRVFRWRAGGGLELLVEGLPSPNGIVLTRDGRMIYVAVTQANAVWRIILGPDGKVAKVGHFLQLSGSLGGGPDGLAMDDADNLHLCHALAGCIRMFDRLGEPLARVATERGLIPTNLAFGDADRRTLYVTEAETGTIQRLRVDVPGRAGVAMGAP